MLGCLALIRSAHTFDSRNHCSSVSVKICPHFFSQLFCLEVLGFHTIQVDVKLGFVWLQLPQELVFGPTPRGKRKIIVATNIAETSVTVPVIPIFALWPFLVLEE